MKQDIELIEQICNETLLMNIKDDDIEVDRLGTKVTERKRPTIVRFVDERMTIKMMQNLRRLKGSPYEGISVTHDLTKLEREEHKKLREERNSMEAKKKSPDITYKIIGPPSNMTIIKVNTKRQENQ